MATGGATKERPADSPSAGSAALVPCPPGDPNPDEMMGTGEAAEIIGKTPRTVERWVDGKKLRGGRPTDLDTGLPVPGSHRWVDARHVVAQAVGAGRTHLIPAHWRHLIPESHRPAA